MNFYAAVRTSVILMLVEKTQALRGSSIAQVDEFG